MLGRPLALTLFVFASVVSLDLRRFGLQTCGAGVRFGFVPMQLGQLEIRLVAGATLRLLLMGTRTVLPLACVALTLAGRITHFAVVHQT